MSGPKNSNVTSITASNARIGILKNNQTESSQNALNTIGDFTNSGKLIDVKDSFAKLILYKIFTLDDGIVLKTIINEVIKELCKNGCLPEDCCYYYGNEECCGNNMAKNINNSIFKSLNNNLLFSDDNFSLLSTEIIEDNLSSTDDKEQFNKIEINEELLNQSQLNSDISSIDSIIKEN